MTRRARRLALIAAFLGAALKGEVFGLEIEQIAEPSSYEAVVDVRQQGPGPGSRAEVVVCESGAVWMRLHVRELVLAEGDSLAVLGEKHGRFDFRGNAWEGRSFFTRSFEGECISLEPNFSSPESRFAIDRVLVGLTALADEPMTVAAVGDLCGTDCDHTAPLVAEMNPALFLALGDLAYPNGTLAEFNSNYHPHYGPFKPITRPSPGNHEYQTVGAAGYFDYFNGIGAPTGPAGDRDMGYSSFDVGDWHVVSLNSNLVMSATSRQVAWLRQDLAANTKPCTLAYWHHPRFTRANYDDFAEVLPAFEVLEEFQTDLVLAGHDHNYQRYRKLTAAGVPDAERGIRSWVVGTGGRGTYPLRADSRRESAQSDALGVLKLVLSGKGYSWEFITEAGLSFTDRGTDTCKRAAQAPAPD